MIKFVEIETAPGEYIETAWINPEEVSSLSSNTLGSDTLITMRGGECYLIAEPPHQVLRKLEIDY